MTPELCLGTAQFGLPYGITNTTGQVSENEVRRILELANENGIEFLDTAQTYGDAEAVLGRTMPVGFSFRLISKLAAQNKPCFTADDRPGWEEVFQQSCARLKQPCLDALLLHRASDLLKPGGNHLRQWLLSLRDRGLVRRLGVSIYSANDLVGVAPDVLDLVQLPLSLYEQRLLHDGTIAQLRAQGCAVHARSIYLQGLLLTPASAWPAWVSSESRLHQANLERLAAKRGCGLIHFALDFARAQNDIEAVVLGLSSKTELLEMLQVWSGCPILDANDMNGWCLQDPDILDPRRWPPL
jgi:aryl-alcohol dehydrogenase-like predicted oxidoreductase